MENKIKTVLCASFCGTGKTFICENSQFKAVEVEYWKYKGIEKEFLQDIKKHIGVVDIIFLQTDDYNCFIELQKLLDEIKILHLIIRKS